MAHAFNPMSIYLLIDGQQAGPFAEQEIAQMRAEGRISDETLAWREGTPAAWLPIGASSFLAPSQEVADKTKLGKRREEANQGESALMGGSLCLILSLILIWSSSLWFFIYIPLLLAAFLLSILAISRTLVIPGFSLLGCTLSLPLLFFLFTFAPPKAAPVTVSNQTPAPPQSQISKYSSLDEKMGFQSYKLGIGESQISGDKLKGEWGWPSKSGESYFNISPKNPLGTIDIEKITLIFKQALLWKISVLTTGRQNCLELKAAFEVAYGSPVESSSMSLSGETKSYEWKGDKCRLIFKILHEDKGEAEFSSPQIDQEVDSRVQAAIREHQQMKDQEADKARAKGAENAKSL